MLCGCSKCRRDETNEKVFLNCLLSYKMHIANGILYFQPSFYTIQRNLHGYFSQAYQFSFPILISPICFSKVKYVSYQNLQNGTLFLLPSFLHSPIFPMTLKSYQKEQRHPLVNPVLRTGSSLSLNATILR